MIECPKCQNKNIQFVSVVNSKKSEKVLEIISTIQGLAIAINIIIGLVVIGLWVDNAKIFLPVVLGTYEISNAIKDTINIAGNAIGIKIATSVFSWLFSVSVWCGIIKLFLPYRTYSYQKCICRACEFQWEYTPPAGIADIGSEHTKP